MHAVVFGMILLARTAARAPADPLSSGPDAPRATDLLRAKRMADEAGKRLQVPPHKRRGWTPGGGGWERGMGLTEPELPTRRRVR